MQLYENTIFQKLVVLQIIYDDDKAATADLMMNIMLIILEFWTTHFPI